MFTYNEVFWLNVTNLVLGLVTLACVLAIGYTAIKEIRSRSRAKAAVPSVADDHSFLVAGLGVTMADGGKKVEDDMDNMIFVNEDEIENPSSKKE